MVNTRPACLLPLLLLHLQLPRSEQMDIKPCLSCRTDPRGRWVPASFYMSGVNDSESVLIPTFLPALSLPSSVSRGRDRRSVLPPTPLAICTSPTPQDPHQTPPPLSPLLGTFPGFCSPERTFLTPRPSLCPLSSGLAMNFLVTFPKSPAACCCTCLHTLV